MVDHLGVKDNPLIAGRHPSEAIRRPGPERGGPP
jgi:hypothetical protein